MHLTTRQQAGFSLVEVMAGLLIGLVTTVVIFQVLAVSEGYKRTATGGSEAVQSGAVSLYLLERDIRQAGAGLDRNRFGDQINASAGSARPFNFILAPVRIVPGTGNTADTITVLYANPSSNGDIKQVAAPGMTTATEDINLSSSFGFALDDPFIIAAGGVNGSLGKVSAAVTDNTIKHQDNAVGIRYNEEGFPVAYPQGASVMNLGGGNPVLGLPGLNQYTVSNNQLQITQFLGDGATDTIADNVVTIKAQYGLDQDGDNVVDTFVLDSSTADGLPTGANFRQVRAIRVAVLVRLGYMEKQAVSPASIKLWPDSTATPTTTGPSVTLSGNDLNFRYRVFTTTIPLRNVIW